MHNLVHSSELHILALGLWLHYWHWLIMWWLEYPIFLGIEATYLGVWQVFIEHSTAFKEFCQSVEPYSCLKHCTALLHFPLRMHSYPQDLTSFFKTREKRKTWFFRGLLHIPIRSLGNWHKWQEARLAWVWPDSVCRSFQQSCWNNDVFSQKVLVVKVSFGIDSLCTDQ